MKTNAITALAWLYATSMAQGTIIYVDASCGDDTKTGTSIDCTDADGPKLTIQNAINTAIDSYEIEVAPGVYNEAINFAGKAIRLRSASGAAVTTIDGTGLNKSVVQCINGERQDTVIDGFTITGGTGSLCFESRTSRTCGGGMFNDGTSPTVMNCVFTENTAEGGGMANHNRSNPQVSHCLFIENSGFHGGGGVENSGHSNPMFTHCSFIRNMSYVGAGGMSNIVGSSPQINRCAFVGNESFGYGGGMYNVNCRNLTVNSCSFYGNIARYDGGGIYDDNADSSITNCTFAGNRARFGGGLFNGGSSPEIVNCTFTENFATIAGGGIANATESPRGVSSPTVNNCILFANNPDQVFNANAESTRPRIGHSILQGGLPASTIDEGGNINSDPIFLDVDGPDDVLGTADDDLRVRRPSPCTDAGDNTAVPTGILTDIDGHERITDGNRDGTATVDIGAYEIRPSVVPEEPLDPDAILREELLKKTRQQRR